MGPRVVENTNTLVQQPRPLSENGLTWHSKSTTIPLRNNCINAYKKILKKHEFMVPKVSFHDHQLKFIAEEDDWLFFSCNKYLFLFSDVAWLTHVSSPVKAPCTNYSSQLAERVKYGTAPNDELRDRLYTSLLVFHQIIFDKAAKSLALEGRLTA